MDSSLYVPVIDALQRAPSIVVPLVREVPAEVLKRRQSRILRRDVAEGAEFRIVTVWDSLDVVRAFAGDDVEAAVVPDVVRTMMVRFDPRVAHYAPVEGEP